MCSFMYMKYFTSQIITCTDEFYSRSKFVFIFFVFKYFNICVIVCSESDYLNKKNNELF